MAKYLITWQIDIEDAEGPVDAAFEAFDIMQRRETSATVFDVKNKETGFIVTVDLMDHLNLENNEN